MQVNPKRNAALDFTKGILVLLMIVYHWGNYFLGEVRYFYDYLRFLTPSFIFITGWIIGIIYTRKYDLNDTRVYKRLIIRGIKVLVLFTILNLVTHGMGLGRRTGGGTGISGFINEAFGIYVSGNSRTASFQVLVPIGYILIFSAPWLWVSRFGKNYLISLALLLTIANQIGEAYGNTSINLALLSFGVLGLVFGFSAIPSPVESFIRVSTLTPVYVAYLALMTWIGPKYWVQLIGVWLSVMLIFAIGQRQATANRIGRGITEIGKYSLVGYVGQIAILQCLRALANPLEKIPYVAAMCLLLAFALTTLLIFALSAATTRSKITNACYRFAFG
jgi:peptidoglycan/LPS O-acetylase OafA/YrhL